ncbi:BPSS1780 family membrane protein [Rubrivivax gelatinosus]
MAPAGHDLIPTDPMPLQLKKVEPARGARWLGDAFALFARRPLAFTAMFAVFLFAALAVSLLPLVGGVLQMMSLPLLSLGFMVASQSALFGGPVTPAQFIEPLRADPARRRSLLLLCLIYGLAAIAILVICDWVSGGAMQRLQELMAQGTVDQAELDALMAEPGVTAAAMLALVLGSLLSVPFWHAPALVHWGRQSVAQSLFSSTLAVWRCKGAFFVYGLAWFVVATVFGIAAALVFSVLGAHSAASMLALPAGLLFSTVFYVSLLFTFNDSFGGAQGQAADGEPPAA